ncbi:MAG: carboxypeptidase regulatory-like domain-containing protein [Eggerthellaceae bacterium]|nr:carboxypeptidase regulatory-like domain-containing protein [Eggerthellaceae bacterium]
MKTILVDPSRCLQCCNCQNSCKDEYCDNDWSPLAAKQGPGQFWIKVHETQSGTGSRMRLDRVPILCQHCEKPACMNACPNKAIHQRDDGIVIIDPAKCKGCGSCKAACGYGVIYFNDEAGISQKCTMCAHLLDAGWEKPRCVNACPVDAISYVDVGELTDVDMYAPLERMYPELETKPRVAYVNLPMPFVAGAVYSPNEDLCLEKVDLHLEGQATGIAYCAQSSMLGEFRIEGVQPGIYALTFSKDGYDTKTISRLDVRDGLNVGDVGLIKTPT